MPHSVQVNPLSAPECQASVGSSVCGRTVENACDADFGSALACTRGDGKYLLKGIYAKEAACGSNQVVSFAKMDVGFLKGRGPSPQSSLPGLPSPPVQPARSNYQPNPNPFQQSYTPQANTPAPYVYPVPSTNAPQYLPPQGK